MIVGFVLILSIVGISLATALYSNFLPYFSLLSDVKNYNMAYYGANTAIERSFSVLRYQEAGFEGTGGRNKIIGDIIDSPLSDKGGFGYYVPSTTTLQRSIIGRPKDSQFMPGTGRGNTDLYLLSGVSNDWNKLDYRRPQQIPLGVDDTPSDQAYIENNDHSISDSSNVMLHLQLIPSVKEKFTDSDPISWKLNDNIDGDGDGIGNDVIVDRGWKGLYDTGSEFSILPRSLVGSETETGDIISLSDDESIREDTINKLVSNSSTIPITFGENFNPLYDNSNSPDNIKPSQKDTHLMISDDSDTTSGISLKDFKNLLGDITINKQELNFFLTRHLISNGDGIYPFLQYRIEFDGHQDRISQPYFTINGKSQVGNYTVQMNVKKSINKNETLGSFTVVF